MIKLRSKNDFKELSNEVEQKMEQEQVQSLSNIETELDSLDLTNSIVRLKKDILKQYHLSILMMRLGNRKMMKILVINIITNEFTNNLI